MIGINRRTIGATWLIAASVMAVAVLLPWHRTSEPGHLPTIRTGLQIGDGFLLLIAIAVAGLASLYLMGRGGVALKTLVLCLSVVSAINLLLVVNGIGLPEATEVMSFSYEVWFYVAGLMSVILIGASIMAFRVRDRPVAESPTAPATWVSLPLKRLSSTALALIGLAGLAALVVGILFFRAPTTDTQGSVESFQWNCDDCEHQFSYHPQAIANLTESWQFTGALYPGTPSFAPGDLISVEATSHRLVALTKLDGAGNAIVRYTTEKEPAVAAAIGLAAWAALGVGVGLLALTFVAFVRKEGGAGRQLSAGSLAAGLLCLAPGLWFLAYFLGRFDAVEYLGLTFLVWVVAAVTGLVLGIRARPRETDARAKRLSASGMWLSTGLTVAWLVLLAVQLEAAFSEG